MYLCTPMEAGADPVDRGDHGSALDQGAQSFGRHVGGQVLAAFLRGHASVPEAGAGDGSAAEELVDEDAEATGDDPAAADGDPEVGAFAQVGDVADRVAVGAGGRAPPGTGPSTTWTVSAPSAPARRSPACAATSHASGPVACGAWPSSTNGDATSSPASDLSGTRRNGGRSAPGSPRADRPDRPVRPVSTPGRCRRVQVRGPGRARLPQQR